MLKLSFGILLLGVLVYGQTTPKPSSTHAVTKRQTTPKPKTPPPLKCKRFSFAVKATSTLWNDEFANPATTKHMTLRWKLETKIHQMFEAVKEYVGFTLVNCKKDKDDTVIYFDLHFEKEGEFSKLLETAVAAGKIGDLVVDKKFVKKECWKPPTPPPTQQPYCMSPCASMCMPSCLPACCSAYPATLPAPPMPFCPDACTTFPSCPAACPPACCRSKVSAKSA